MPAKSKAQQKFMGMVHAAQTGEKPASKEVAKVAKDMPKKAAKDFASTKHKGLPAHVEEARTEVKDKTGKVTSWKEEGEWKKSTGKAGRGKVTNLSDKARRETEKSSKVEKDMAESFKKAMEGSIRGGVWTSQPPDKGQKDVPPPQEVDGGILNKKQPKPVNAPRPVKKAEVDAPAQAVAVATGDEEQVNAGMKRTGKKVSEAKGKPDFLDMDKDGDKKEPMKKAVADKKKNPFGNKKKDEKVSEALKGKQKELDVAKPKGKLTGADFKALKGKKKVKESTEDRLMAIARNALQAVQMLRESKKEAARVKHLPISESDEYFAGLNAQLKKQIKG